MLIDIHPDNPQPRKIAEVVKVLRDGGVIIYPTDTVYGIGCDINNRKAVEKICKIRGINPKKANFSFICADLSHISDFCTGINNATFKLMKWCLPGPYTFILPAKNTVPKLFQSNKKTVGIRVPDNLIPRLIVEELGNPIMTASVVDEDDVIEYTSDPSLIYEKYFNQVDLVIDGGYGGNEGSTVIDCSRSEPEILREGKGPVDEL